MLTYIEFLTIVNNSQMVYESWKESGRVHGRETLPKIRSEISKTFIITVTTSLSVSTNFLPNWEELNKILGRKILMTFVPSKK